VAADLGVEPAGDRFQTSMSVSDHLRRGGGQVQRGEPFPARAASAPGWPVVTVAGQDGVDPVAQQRPQPDQLDAVPQQRAELPHLGRGDRGFGQQVRAEKQRQHRRVDFVFS
jgi:hypothetical protein